MGSFFDNALGQSQDPADAGKRAGLPTGLLEAVVGVESGGKPTAVSSKGAVGAAQVEPASGAQPGYGIQGGDPHDVNTGARILKGYLDGPAKGDIMTALAMYNAGPKGNLDNPETKAYVDKVMKKWKPQGSFFDLAATGKVGVPAAAAQPQRMSPLAAAPPGQQAQQPPQQPHPLMDAINRPADRTVELMGQDTMALLNDVHSLVKNPSGKGAFKVALDALGIPFSPITSMVDAFVGDPLVNLAHYMGASPKVDPYVRAAAQVALPIAGSKSKIMKDAMDPVGKFLSGAMDAREANAIKSTQAGLIAHQLGVAQGQVDKALTRALSEVQAKAPGNYQSWREDLYHAIDTGKFDKLDPEAKAFWKNELEPVSKKTALLRQQLASYGVDVGPDVTNYLSRKLVGGGKSKFWDFTTPIDVRMGRSMSRTAPELKPRTVHSVYDPNRQSALVVVEQPEESTAEKTMAIAYRNKQAVGQGVVTNGRFKWSGQSGQGYSMKLLDAPVKEIEQHTDLQYHKDPIASVLEANVNMQRALINAKAIEQIKVSPEFQALARRPSQTAPPGWQPVEITGTHQFDGYKMDPHLAEVMRDFQGNVHGEWSERLGKLNRLVIGSLFFNPLPHIANVLTHSIVEKGLVGNTIELGKEAYRFVMPGLTPTTVEAWKAVWNKDHNYMKYLNEGAGLMYPSVYTRNFFDQVLKAVGSSPQAADMAKGFGYSNPQNWISAVYGASRKSLWFVNDVIMMQAYLEKERAGVPIGQAIADVERHIPNYNVPSRVMGSRSISLALRNPAINAFGRYDYGRLASYGHMLSDLVRTDKGLDAAGRVKALDQIAATAFVSFFVYPQVMDKAAQAITGNKDASWVRYGPTTIPHLVYEYMEGRQDWSGAVSSALPSGAAFKILSELRTGRNSYNGAELMKHPQDIVNYALDQMAPVGLIDQVLQGRKSAEQQLWAQMGIKDPSPAQKAKFDKWVERNRKERQKFWEGSK